MANRGEGTGPAREGEAFYVASYVADHTWFLESLDRVERAMRSSNELKEMLPTTSTTC
jgi:hypothetical protein